MASQAPAATDSPSTDDAPRRRYTRLDRDNSETVCVIDARSSMQGLVVDESFGGIGLLFDSEVELKAGQIVQFFYNGVETSAVVRHVRREGGQVRVGIEWLAEGLAREIREKTANRAVHLDNESLDAFLQILPGGVSMMWKFLEAEKWAELEATVERLRRSASKCALDRLVSAVEAVGEALGDADRKRQTGWAMFALVRECVQAVGK